MPIAENLLKLGLDYKNEKTSENEGNKIVVENQKIKGNQIINNHETNNYYLSGLELIKSDGNKKNEDLISGLLELIRKAEEEKSMVKKEISILKKEPKLIKIERWFYLWFKGIKGLDAFIYLVFSTKEAYHSHKVEEENFATSNWFKMIIWIDKNKEDYTKVIKIGECVFDWIEKENELNVDNFYKECEANFILFEDKKYDFR